jgi:hypothetical protein
MRALNKLPRWAFVLIVGLALGLLVAALCIGLGFFGYLYFGPAIT